MSDFGSQPHLPPPTPPGPPPAPFGTGGIPAPPPLTPPPGYVPYGGSPGAVGPFSRIGGVAKALVILQIVSVAAAVLQLVFQVSLVSKADDVVSDTLTLSEFRDTLGPFLLVSLLAGAVALAALVLLIIWSFRIAQNLQRLGRPITWKPGLTIVVWLLGGCTLSVINFLMLREHWKASDPEVPPHDPSYTSRPVSPLVVGWFVLSLVQVVIGFGSGVRSFGGVSVGGNDTESIAESLSDRLPLVVGAGLASVASSVVLILLIKQLTARHARAIGEA